MTKNLMTIRNSEHLRHHAEQLVSASLKLCDKNTEKKPLKQVWEEARNSHKMRMIIKNLFPIIVLIFYSGIISANAQSFKERAGIGFFAGASKYSGSMPTTLTRAAAGLNFRYEITDNIAVRFQFTATETGGSDSSLNNFTNNGNDIRSPFYYFRTNINEFSLIPEYNFFNINAGAKFIPYVFAGIGYYNFKPYQIDSVARGNGTFRLENIAMKQVEKYTNWQINVPIGVGFKYAVSPNILLNLEGNYRFLLNKYIDNYIADNKKDSYYTITLGISFRLSPITAHAGNSSGGGKYDKNCKCPPVY